MEQSNMRRHDRGEQSQPLISERGPDSLASGKASAAPQSNSSEQQSSVVKILVFSCFLATFSFYFERTGFPIVFTKAAKSIGRKGLDETTKGQVLSSFFWGYALSQIPASAVAHKHGGYYTLAGAFLGWASLCFFEPLVMTVTPLLMFVRVLIGISQGFVIPSIHSLLAASLSKGDKSKAVSFVTSGMYLGSSSCYVVMPSVVSYYGTNISLAAIGGIGFMWLAAWLLMKDLFGMASSRDSKHQTSPKESTLPTTSDHLLDVEGSVPRRGSAPKSSESATIPWSRMLQSSAVWAIIVNNFVFHYSVYVIMNWLPTYFEYVIKVELTGLGVAKALPYLAMFGASNFGGIAGEYMIMTLHWSTRMTRIILNTAGLGLSAVTIYLMCFASSQLEGLFVVTCSLSFLGISRGGFAVNHMDIAPEFAGVIMGISNTAGTVAGFLGVAFTGYLLEASGGASEIEGWRHALGFASVLNVCGLLVFQIYAKGTRVFNMISK